MRRRWWLRAGTLAAAASDFVVDGDSRIVDAELLRQFQQSRVQEQKAPVQAPSVASGAFLSPLLSPNVDVENNVSLDARGIHSPLFLAFGLLFSLCACLSIFLLSIVALASLCDSSLPLLAMLPAGSNAALVILLTARAGSGIGGSCAHLTDIARPLAWALPASPDNELWICVLLFVGVALTRFILYVFHSRLNWGWPYAESPEEVHSKIYGPWELRCLGLLAFPLVTSSIRVLSGETEYSFFTCVVAASMLAMLVCEIFYSLNFVTEAVDEGNVMMVTLPETAHNGEVFVDRWCSQLLALPLSPLPPDCSGFNRLLGDWFTSPSWCVAPTVASIFSVEVESGLVHRSFPQAHQLNSPNAGQGDFEDDELQGRPLLDREEPEQTAPRTDPQRADESENNENRQDQPGRDSKPRLKAKPSVVNVMHPLSVSTIHAYDVRSRESIAGIACVPWLDAAVPADVFRHLKDLNLEIPLQVHPGQLSGRLSHGRYAACFDWGTRWPWRWPYEVAMRASLGIWIAMPLDWAPLPLVTALHVAFLGLVGAFAYMMTSVKPFTHRIDNAAIIASSWASVLIVFLRLFDVASPTIGLFFAIVYAVCSLLPCGLLLLAAVALATITLARLETQGLRERMFSRTIHGWGRLGTAETTPPSSMPPTFGRSESLMSGCGASTGVQDLADDHSVEVTFPGQRRAMTIVLPACVRPRVVHTQLLPAVSGRGGEPETLPQCNAKAETPRLPVAPELLFPQRPQEGSIGITGSTEADGSPESKDLQNKRVVTPLAALLVPGRPGCLIYPDAALNEEQAEWQHAIHSYFGEACTALADEAERLVQEHIAEVGRVLVIIEVLPAFAAEFVDERHAPPGTT